jgi:hypothetical protein
MKLHVHGVNACIRKPRTLEQSILAFELIPIGLYVLRKRSTTRIKVLFAAKQDDVVVELSKYQGLIASMSGSHELGLLKKKKVAITDFWSGLTSFPLLQTIANVVFNVVCSSAAAERNFSTHKFVHSSMRNRLAPARVEKLVHLFFNGKNCSTDELVFLDEFVPLEEEEAADVNHDDDVV